MNNHLPNFPPIKLVSEEEAKEYILKNITKQKQLHGFLLRLCCNCFQNIIFCSGHYISKIVTIVTKPGEHLAEMTSEHVYSNEPKTNSFSDHSTAKAMKLPKRMSQMCRLLWLLQLALLC